MPGLDGLEEVIEEVGYDEIDTIGELNPALADALRRKKQGKAGGGKKRDVRGNLAEGEPINSFLQMTNGNAAVAAGASVALTGAPNRNFWPDQLILQFDGVAVTLTALTVANMPMLGGSSGDVPGDSFKKDAIIPFPIEWRVIPAQQTIVATVKNNHAATATAIFGTVYGRTTI